MTTCHHFPTPRSSDMPCLSCATERAATACAAMYTGCIQHGRDPCSTCLTQEMAQVGSDAAKQMFATDNPFRAMVEADMKNASPESRIDCQCGGPSGHVPNGVLCRA